MPPLLAADRTDACPVTTTPQSTKCVQSVSGCKRVTVERRFQLLYYKEAACIVNREPGLEMHLIWRRPQRSDGGPPAWLGMGWRTRESREQHRARPRVNTWRSHIGTPTWTSFPIWLSGRRPVRMLPRRLHEIPLASYTEITDRSKIHQGRPAGQISARCQDHTLDTANR